MAFDLEYFLCGLGPVESRSFAIGRPVPTGMPVIVGNPPSPTVQGGLRGLVRRHLEVRPKAAAWALKHVL
jgi:hypothetical protein